MLSFPIGGQRFNYRVAGIVVLENHVLVCREDDDPYVMLPGGRVEMGEASAPALVREIREEMAMEARVGEMALTSESFYLRDGEAFHEMGLFYRMRLPAEARPGGRSPWLVRPDEGHVLSFDWVPLSGDALERVDLLPRFLPALLRDMPAGLVHVVHDERGGPEGAAR